MIKNTKVVVLLVDSNADVVRQVEQFLHEDPHRRYVIIWKANLQDAVSELLHNPDIDVVLTEYFFSSENDLGLGRLFSAAKNKKPIILITTNKDFDLAIEVMKLGVAEYIAKDELSTARLSNTIGVILEKQKLENELMNLEIVKHRLEAMRDAVADFLNDIKPPIAEMDDLIRQLHNHSHTVKEEHFLNIIQVNISRLMKKFEQLRTLNKDKTVKYIKDIRMIDLS